MRFDSRAGMRLVAAVHEFWYRLTDGWIGSNVMGTPVLLLTTTGRKTGRRHSTPLVYLEEGDEIIIIASNNGSDRDPQWWLNLKANPAAVIQVRNKRRKMHAEAAQGEERARLWATITSRYGQYKQYERRTSREIPVVKLIPAAAAPSEPQASAESSEEPPKASETTDVRPTASAARETR